MDMDWLRLAPALTLCLTLVACANERPAMGSDAEECGLSRKAVLPLTMARSLPFVVTVIDGERATLLVDTFAEESALTPEFVQHLGAASGTSDEASVRPQAIKLGDAVLHEQTLRVGRLTDPELTGLSLDGRLGADLLSFFDVDLDLPDGQMTLYDPVRCARDFIPWRFSKVAIPIQRSAGGRLLVPVLVNEQPLPAALATGTRYTVITITVAERLGVTSAMLADDRKVTDLGPITTAVPFYHQQFERLQVGYEVFHYPMLYVADVPAGQAEMLLGMDILRSRRLWLSYATSRVFFARPAGWVR